MKPESRQAECQVRNLVWSQILARRAVELSEFIIKNRGRAFEGWPVPLIFQYCFYHLAEGTAFTVRDKDGIAGVAFAWGMSPGEIRRRDAAGESPFQWERSVDGAGGLFLAEVIAAEPKQKAENRKQKLQRLYRQMLKRWPDFARKKIYTYRAGKLVELSAAAIAKMVESDGSDSSDKSDRAATKEIYGR